MNYTKKKTGWQKFFSGKGFYAALSICIAATALIAWAALNQPSKTVFNPPATQPQSSSMRSVYEPTAKANAPVTGVPDERTAAETTAAVTAPAAETAAEAAASVYGDPEKQTPFKSYYMLPLGTEIVKDYSGDALVYSNTLGDYRAHIGVDFKGDKAEIVKAINDGIVIDVYKDNLWGNVVVIDQGCGLVARYCGLGDNPPVPKDATVKMGDTIGEVGDLPIERADGYHLHLELYLDGRIVDPIEAMGKTPAGG